MMKARWRSRLLLVSVLALFGVLGVLTTSTLRAGGGQGDAASANDKWLNGTIDFHTHAAPDMEKRKFDAVDLVKLAKAKGMRGIVLKNHFVETGSLAFIVRKVVPGIEVFGGITLNRTVGGLNSRAVENMAQLEGGYGKVVWFPTRDAEAQVAGEVGRNPAARRPSVPVSKNGTLLPEAKEVIAMIAKHQLVLETGHSTADESLMLVREGHSQGVQQMLITHAATYLSIAQMQEATKEGAFIEWIRNSLPLTPGVTAKFTAAEEVAALRTVGVQFCVLATDFGQPANLPPPDGLAEYMAMLAAAGMTENELATMTKDNPAKLLGLPHRPPNR